MTRVARVATEADVPIIRGLVERAYGPYIERMDRVPAPILADYERLVADGVVTVIDDSERGIVGVLVSWVDGDSYYVDNVAVDPDAQGTGLGRLLLDVADEQARAAGRSRVRLYTNAAMHENLHYYPRQGFIEIDRRRDEGYDRVFYERQITIS
jgi:ribosomal protein S18 acetylase RimI-like enzyme